MFETDISKLRLLGKGLTAEVFYWEHDKVCKLFYDWMPFSTINYEYKIAKNCYLSGVQTPKPFRLIRLENRYGIIFELLDCDNFDTTLVKKIWKTLPLCKEAVKHQLIINSIEAVDMVSYSQRAIETVQNSNLFSDDEKIVLFDYIKALKEDTKLCHGDYHGSNILVFNSKFYIIDWTFAFSGPPEADAARTWTIIRYGAPIESKNIFVNLFFFMFDYLRVFTSKAYLRLYSKESSIPPTQVEQWLLAAACIRVVEVAGVNFYRKRLLKFIRKEIKKRRLSLF